METSRNVRNFLGLDRLAIQTELIRRSLRFELEEISLFLRGKEIVTVVNGFVANTALRYWA